MSHDVSRETPPTPEKAPGAFPSERLPLAERYVAWLAGAGVERGLIGPREAPRLWQRHVLNCAALGEVLPENAHVADLGSGAGLPGLVVALARPDLRVTLVEPLLRRTTFLEEVVADLGLEQVQVVRARAEELHGVERFDVVTSRAVAPLGKLLRWSMPLVRAGGAMLAMKGSSIHEEIAVSQRDLRQLRCAEPEVLSVGVGLVDPPTTLVRVVAADPAGVG